MKKEEAMLLVPHRVKLVIEYIEQILGSGEKIYGDMNFSSYNIDNERMCTLDIVVGEDFEKHINLGISMDHCDVLYEQLFSGLLETFLEHETIGVSRFFTIKNELKPDFSGISALNASGGKIEINFSCKGEKFDDITSFYNKQINEYIDRISSGRKIPSR